MVGTDGVEPPSPGLQPGAMNRFSCIPLAERARLERAHDSSSLVDVADRCLSSRPPLQVVRRFAAPLIAGCAALPRSPGRARSAQRRGAILHAAREISRKIEMDDAVFKGRGRTDVHDRARGEHGVIGGTRTQLRLAPQASASTASASITMAGPDGVEPPSCVLEAHSSPRHEPGKHRGDRLRADPLVELTGASVRQL